jgi:hypothetical protein
MICPVHKKGNVAVSGNYRPISLTETPRKMFGAIINTAIEEEGDLAPSRKVSQNGSRFRKRIFDAILALQKTNIAYHRSLVLPL